jgi:transposase
MINNSLCIKNLDLNNQTTGFDISLHLMNDFLKPTEIATLKSLHRKADKKQRDKIKGILLLNRGYAYSEIAEILLIDQSTVWRWYESYLSEGVDGLMKDNYTGGTSKLTERQQTKLIEHLESNMYLTAKEISAFVKKTFRITYTPKGMTSLLHQFGFTYKKPKHIPGKANSEAQKEFLKEYRNLQTEKSPEDKIYFMDGVHPMHNSQPAYGWIRRGRNMVIKSNTGRQRINLNGAYNLEDHTVVIQEAEMINGQSTVSLLTEMLKKQPLGLIYVILDNAKYYRSEFVKDFVNKNKRIRLMFLPPYSPNLNVIERLWKFFKKKILYNTYYEQFAVFRKYCLNFFKNIEKFRTELQTLMTDNFQIIQA